eukprot:gb/GECG01002510.1/.p1 GENE.gb/GECG01002510.1/~~gb/GECG01002510.1/.p1  ORF type:complete len:635 (+),score=84.35 gb/GECG01002510.1/:1-1905(+)
MSRHRAIRADDYDLDDIYDDADPFADEYEYINDPAYGGGAGDIGALKGYYMETVQYEEDADILLEVIPGVLKTIGEDIDALILVEALREADYNATVAASLVFEKLEQTQQPEVPIDTKKSKNNKKKNKKKNKQGQPGTSTASAVGSSSTEEAASSGASRAVSTEDATHGGGAASSWSKYSVAFPHSAGSLPHIPEAVERYMKEMKPNINLIVTGHVDAGKSTIMGHFLYQLGQVDQRLMHKYKKESETIGKGSFAYAWVLDEEEEERSRGMTVDVGINYFETEKYRFTLLDSPGHKDFVPNMITAASQADAAILVVSVIDNEFQAGLEKGGQTREHAILVRSFGITKLVVALNKIDKINWDKSQYDKVTEKLLKYLGRAGFRSENIRFVPVSGLSGWNLDNDSTSMGSDTASWYTGPSLLRALETVEHTVGPSLDTALRFPIADAYKTLHHGLVISGRVESGFITPQTRVALHPGQHTAFVKSISRGNALLEAAVPGDTVELSLSGVEENLLGSGQVACWTQFPVPVVTEFRAQLATFEALKIPIVAGQQFTLHTQHVEIPCTVNKLRRTFNSDGTLAVKKPRHVSRNTNADVTIRVAKPIPFERYNDNKRLGRFILRYAGSTVAAGIVLSIKG